MKISIGIVLYKGEKYLEACLSSLLEQSFFDFELLLRDQSPKNEAFLFLKTYCPTILNDPRVHVFTGENLFHSGGHNYLIDKMTGEAYICASNDMLYDKKFLENIIEETKIFPEYSVYVPKLRQWNFSAFLEKKKTAKRVHEGERGETDFLDSCGIGVQKNHYFFDRGQGEKDRGQYDYIEKREIFGGSGALFLIKKSALEKIRYLKNVKTTQQNSDSKEKEYEYEYEYEYFDEDIHYKNDVDLAYRLQWAGENTLFCPRSLAYHDRQLGGSVSQQNRKSLWMKESSFFGQRVVLQKNVWGRNLPFSISFSTFIRSNAETLFLLFTHPRVVLQYVLFWKHKKNIQEKKNMMCIQNTPKRITQFFE